MSYIIKEYIKSILKEEKEKDKTLYVFGFVDSLYNYRKDRWNESVVSDIKKAFNDPNGITALCTARAKEEEMVSRTMQSLRSRNIKFDYNIFRGKEVKGTTPQYKVKAVKILLKELENVKTVYFWDDRDDVLQALKEIEITDNIRYVPIKVKI
jgi:hypothetical protein